MGEIFFVDLSAMWHISTLGILVPTLVGLHAGFRFGVLIKAEWPVYLTIFG